ncbi:protein Bsp1p [Monosporozyma unispora]
MTRHHHRMRPPRKDVELDQFLSNVENLQEKRTGELDDYNNLDNLAYKSAYNYDRTFSSSLKGINPYPSDNEIEVEQGEYVVSREDYILLQKIKQQQQQGEPQKQTERIPSRGKPRGHDLIGIEEAGKEESGPKLPPRKPKELDKIDPYEQRFQRYKKNNSKNKEEEPAEEEIKPALPKRNQNKPESSKKPQVVPREISDKFEIHERNKPKPLPKTPPKHNDSNIVSVKYSQEIELIDLTDDDENKAEEENKPALSPKPSFKKDLKLIVKRESKPMQLVSPEPIEMEPPKPRINRESKPVGFINSLQNNKLTTSNVNNKSTSSLNRSKPIDYLDSMQNNNTTSISTHRDNLLNSPTLSSKHLDYLDSMSGNATTTVTTHKISQPSSPSRSPTRLPKSESFIESALKNSESSNNLSLKKKPLLPTKPQNLTDNNKVKPVKPPKREGLIELPQLRKVERPTSSPQKLSIQENIDLPKLQSVKKKIPPPVNKSNKPSGIELPQLQTVNKNTPPPVNKTNKPNLPEALLKRDNLNKNGGSRHLNKARTVPSIPERKISMPEALKRAQQLKQAKNQSTINPDSTPQSIEDKLSSVLTLQKRHTLGDGSSAFNRSSGSSNNSPTPTMSSNHNSTSSLPQLTKGRTKGPKRKLPTNI